MTTLTATSPDTPAERFRARGAWHVWLPMLVLACLCVPHVRVLLPAPIDFTDEIYQPMQALKFLSTHGQAYHKYGPTPNYLLLPFYGATLAYWKVAHVLGKPSGDWPYGLAHPIDQLGTLVLETRLVCLALSMAALGILSAALARATGSKAAAGLAMLAVVVGNYIYVWNAPIARPDGIMVALMAMAFAVMLRVATEGLTVRRGVVFGILCSASVGAKENAGPILVLAYVAMFAHRAWLARRDPNGLRLVLKVALYTAAAGALFYAVTNIAPAPSVWLDRMKFWLAGDGLNGDVWARSPSRWAHAVSILGALWDNVGPLGGILVPVMLAIGIVRRPLVSAVFLLPAAGAVATLVAIPYTPNRFVLPMAPLLAILVGFGLAECLRSRAAKPVVAFAVLTIAVNMVWCTVTWHMNQVVDQVMIESALPSLPRDASISYAEMFPNIYGLRRLEGMGYNVDLRAMQNWTDGKRPLPDVVFGVSGKMQMYEESRSMPARAAYYRRLSDFDIARWPGMRGLGYGEPQRISVHRPAYLGLFNFMPGSKDQGHSDILIYRRNGVG